MACLREALVSGVTDCLISHQSLDNHPGVMASAFASFRVPSPVISPAMKCDAEIRILYPWTTKQHDTDDYAFLSCLGMTGQPQPQETLLAAVFEHLQGMGIPEWKHHGHYVRVYVILAIRCAGQPSTSLRSRGLPATDGRGRGSISVRAQ